MRSPVLQPDGSSTSGFTTPWRARTPEFSKIRFQYNYDDRAGIGKDHSFWVQFEFILGAHAAHKF